MNQSGSEHIDGGLALFQYDIPYEGFVVAILRLHVHKNDLAKNGAKSLDLNLRLCGLNCGSWLLRRV